MIRAGYTGFAGLFGLVGLAVLLTGAVGLVSGHVGPGAGLVVGSLVPAGLAWLFWSLTRREGPALTMRVCRQAITMSRDNRVTDTVERPEVGLVVIRSFGRAGVGSFEIYGPDHNPVGSWEANWGTSSGFVRATRAFGRLGYPWVLHDQLAVVGRAKIRSKLAPPWTDEVLRR